MSLATNLRALRTTRGLSAAELARRAGIARATLTQLEAGGGNPTLETLYGLANALDATLADLIAEPPPVAPPRVVRTGTGARVTGQAVDAWLVDTVTGRGGGPAVEIYDFRLHTGAVQHSAAHTAGTREHLFLTAGRVQAGPTGHAVELGAGDFVTFDGGVEHLYRRIGRTVPRGVLVMTHPG